MQKPIGLGYAGTAPRVGLRLPPDDVAAIDALAEKVGASRSEVVRRALAAYMAAHAESAEVFSAA